MTAESSSRLFACASLLCSLSFWMSAILSHFPGVPTMNLSGVHWLALIGVSILLAVVSFVLNFECKLWIPAVALAVVTFLFVMYAMGT